MTALRETPAEAIELIKSFEGIPDGDPSTVNLDAYLDPVGIWTIGWGHAVQFNGAHLKGAENRAIARRLFPGGITRAQAHALLVADLIDRAPSVLRLVKVPLSDNQFGALMSFTFNSGAGRLATSTLLRLLNARDYEGAADQLLVWNKARNRNGVLIELAGLTRRRRAERAMFLGQDWRAASGEPPRTRSGPPPGAGLPAGVEALDAPVVRTRRARAAAAPAPERPVAPSAAVQRAAAKASAERRGVKDKSAPATPRARTTTPKAPPPAARARRPAPRKGR